METAKNVTLTATILADACLMKTKRIDMNNLAKLEEKYGCPEETRQHIEPPAPRKSNRAPDIKVTLGSQAKFENLPAHIARQIQYALTCPNPKFQQLSRLNKYTGSTPRQLHYFFSKQTPSGVTLICPAGFTMDAVGIIARAGLTEFDVQDDTESIPAPGMKFKGTLRDLQQDAVDDILPDFHGVLVAGTGAGKTVMALAIIAERSQKTLVVVHTLELLNQWVDRMETFLGIPADQVGIIGNGKFRIGDQVTVGMVQTCRKRIRDIKNQFGMVVCDECHRAPATTFTELIDNLTAHYRLGLTATPYRRDGLNKVINIYMGPVRHEIKKSKLLQEKHLVNAEVSFEATRFFTSTDASEYYTKVISELAADPERNKQICRDVAFSKGDGIRLVLTDRREHARELQDILSLSHGIHAGLLIGGMSKKDREAVAAGIDEGSITTLICTGQLIGEGYDLPGIESLFLAMPIKFSGRLIQYIGRALRPAAGKSRARIFDYVDIHVGVLHYSAKTRAKVYRDEQIYIRTDLDDLAKESNIIDLVESSEWDTPAEDSVTDQVFESPEWARAF